MYFVWIVGWSHPVVWLLPWMGLMDRKMLVCLTQVSIIVQYNMHDPEYIALSLDNTKKNLQL